MKLCFENAWIVTMDKARPYVRGTLVTDGDRIVSIGKKPEGMAFDRVVDCRGGIVMPPLCNTHTHLPMTLMRGSADDLKLRDWLYRYIFPMEARLDPYLVEIGARAALAELIKGGVGCVVDMYLYPFEIAKVLTESRMQGLVVCGDNDRDGDLEAHLDRQRRVLGLKGDRVRGGLGFHAQYTCSTAYLDGIAELSAEYGVGVVTHNSETLDEVGTCAARYDLSPTMYLHKLGIWDQGGIAAHCVHCDKDDLALLDQCGVAVSVNCGSNLKLGSGIPPVVSMQSRGNLITLGTDGAASNNRLDLWRELYLCSVLPKGALNSPDAAAAPEVLRWATENGYRAAGFEGGTLKEGGVASLILVDTQGLENTPVVSPASTLVYTAGRENVRYNVCCGEVLYADGEFTNGWSEAQICDDLRRAQKELFRRAELGE